MSRWIVVCSVLLLAACGGSDNVNSPTAPTTTTPPPPPSQPTRIIGVSGNLTFGDVEIGQTRTATATITNSGTGVLTVTGMTVSGGLAPFLTASWTNGQIAAGASQVVTVAFAPTTAGPFAGTITVTADHTSGGNTLPISATVVDLTFAGTWTGTYTVERCDGVGSVQDIFCSANRGVFPVGSTLPIRLDLNQSGSSVSGTVAFGQVRGNVSGNITSGTLTLQGTGTSGQFTATLSSWSTRVQGRTMTGNVTYNLTWSGLPGTAVVVTRVSLNR